LFMHDFRKLHVWRRARDTVVIADRMTRQFPRADQGVIAAQVRRAVISIPANIAEGCGKSSRKETIRFLQIAAGSAAEAESHLEVAYALNYLNAKQYQALLGELDAIQRMLRRLTINLP
jgi:four helix bundle protein